MSATSFLFFPAIYALTSTPDAFAIASRAVLEYSLSSASSLPPTMRIPRAALHPTARTAYVLAHLSRYRFRWDRELPQHYAYRQHRLRRGGRRVVGLDLYRNPVEGDVSVFKVHFGIGKEAGLGAARYQLSVSTPCESPAGWRHDILGHATFLSDDAKSTFSLPTALPQLPPIKTASSVVSRDANRAQGSA
ncbi:hypothetical protein BV22DRAFT_607268 [Leucogyrophana mollusca]|uniref:Uncharacterized protein n=1 Tax=Leucogyrophana mollusca TaxID=85980 RepID=A0ACB8BEA8_9AGAM|nr:hypothetical protein BV22DRAFT_607268 [Leucogyrophana mollusca]